MLSSKDPAQIPDISCSSPSKQCDVQKNNSKKRWTISKQAKKHPCQMVLLRSAFVLSLHENITDVSYANSVVSSSEEALRTTLCKAWPLAKAIKLAAASQKLWVVDDWEKLHLITHIIHGTGIFNYMLVDFLCKCRYTDCLGNYLVRLVSVFLIKTLVKFHSTRLVDRDAYNGYYESYIRQCNPPKYSK